MSDAALETECSSGSKVLNNDWANNRRKQSLNTKLAAPRKLPSKWLRKHQSRLPRFGTVSASPKAPKTSDVYTKLESRGSVHVLLPVPTDL